MTPELRSLLMRANRLLGASLVEANLVTVDQLEAANEKLLELLGAGESRKSTLLGVLAYDLKAVKEEDLLHHCVDEHGLGLIDLRSYDASDELKSRLDLDTCWATWSIPFDKEDDFTFVATAYYLSPAVRTYWEKQIGGNIVWYGTTLDDIADHLERLAAAPAKR
jgi:hypothetical protein